jgi:hypothetical protein
MRGGLRCGVTEPQVRESGKTIRGKKNGVHRERHPSGRWQLPR